MHDRAHGKVVNGEEYADRRILTLREMVQFAKWLASEAKAGKPKDRDMQRSKIVEMLELRKRLRYGGR